MNTFFGIALAQAIKDFNQALRGGRKGEIIYNTGVMIGVLRTSYMLGYLTNNQWAASTGMIFTRGLVG